jgi:hypothetical protein
LLLVVVVGMDILFTIQKQELLFMGKVVVGELHCVYTQVLKWEALRQLVLGALEEIMAVAVVLLADQPALILPVLDLQLLAWVVVVDTLLTHPLHRLAMAVGQQILYLQLTVCPGAVVSGLVAEDAIKPQAAYSSLNGNHHEKLRNH